MGAPGFWDDPETAQKVSQEVTRLREPIEEFSALAKRYEDVETLWQLGMEEGDNSLYSEVAEMLAKLRGCGALAAVAAPFRRIRCQQRYFDLARRGGRY